MNWKTACTKGSGLHQGKNKPGFIQLKIHPLDKSFKDTE